MIGKSFKKSKGKPKGKKPYKRVYKKPVISYAPKVEKKRSNTTYANADATMGQCAGNSTAQFSSNITPVIAQGAGVSERIGSSVSLVSMYMTLQLRQMPSCTAPVNLIFYIVRAKGYNDNTSSIVVTDLFNTNNYIGVGNQIYDTGSDMNIDQFKNYTILKKLYVNLKPDQFSGQQMPTTRQIGLKFKKPLELRYKGNSSTEVAQGNLFLLGFASNGNASTSVASTLANIPISAVNTGQYINYNIKYYYTDA